MHNENLQQTELHRFNLQSFSAILMLLAGIALAAAALFMPPQGEISASVCTVFAQCLIYAGSVFGITQYLTLKAPSSNPSTTSDL